MDLFVPRYQGIEFEKAAAETTLPESPNAWPQAILNEVFKQAPFLSDYHPEVEMDRVDAEQGYGLGYINVSTKSEVGPNPLPAQRDAISLRSIRIPVIIAENKLQPLDLLVTEDGKCLPLNERRVRQAMFRPTPFDVTGKATGDTSIVGTLYPPYRQNAGFGGGGMSTSIGMGKTSSILSHILQTIDPITYNNFVQKIAQEEIKFAYRENMPAMEPALKVLASYTPPDRMKEAQAMLERLPASVTQIVKEGSAYRIKTANHKFWTIADTGLVDRGVVYRNYGAKIAEQVDTAGSVTLTDVSPSEDNTDQNPENKAQPVTTVGLYTVLGEDGQQRTGTVIPNLMGLDGVELPIALFTNGSETALQEEIVGIPSGTTHTLPASKLISGHGCFYTTTDGGIQATVPVHLTSGFNIGGSRGWTGTTMEGDEVEIKMQPNIKKPVRIDAKGTGPASVLIPEDYKWLPLGADKSIALVDRREDFQKEGSDQSPYVYVSSDGTSFTLRGPLAEKLAYEERNFLSTADVMFVLGGFGANFDTVPQKLAQAAMERVPVAVKVARVITPIEETHDAAIKTAQEKVRDFDVNSLRKDLVKEAAAIPEATSVDAVLSLGFINPDNVLSFIEHLPDLELAQGHLCDLLIAARIGLRTIPKAALEKAVRNIEETIDGLRVLAFEGGLDSVCDRQILHVVLTNDPAVAL